MNCYLIIISDYIEWIKTPKDFCTEPTKELYSIDRASGPSFISASPILLGPCQAF